MKWLGLSVFLGVALRSFSLHIAGLGAGAVAMLLLLGLIFNIFGQLLIGRSKWASATISVGLAAFLASQVDRLGGNWRTFLVATAVQDLLFYGLCQILRTNEEVEKFVEKYGRDPADPEPTVLDSEPVAEEPRAERKA